jgi:V/A-type H+-transporting ATPase subunit F
VKFFVIGDQETVLGLRLVGVEGSVAVDREDALAAMKEAVARDDVGVVLVTEKVAAGIRDEVESRLYGVGFPLVLEIPDSSGPVPDRLKIEEIVRRAIGINL